LIKDAPARRRISSRQAAGKIGIAHTPLKRVHSRDVYELKTANQISNWLRVKLSTIKNGKPPVYQGVFLFEWLSKFES
jgi:hypothetical protein